MGPPWDFEQSMGNRKVNHWALDVPTGWWLNRNTYLDIEPGSPPDWYKMFSPTQLWGEPKGQYYAVLMSDPWFANKVKNRWNEVSASLAGLGGYIDSAAEVLDASARLNFSPRASGGAGQPVAASFLETNPEVFVFANDDPLIDPLIGWQNEVSLLRNWISDRNSWLDAQFSASGAS